MNAPRKTAKDLGIPHVTLTSPAGVALRQEQIDHDNGAHATEAATDCVSCHRELTSPIDSEGTVGFTVGFLERKALADKFSELAAVFVDRAMNAGAADARNWTTAAAIAAEKALLLKGSDI